MIYTRLEHNLYFFYKNAVPTKLKKLTCGKERKTDSISAQKTTLEFTYIPFLKWKHHIILNSFISHAYLAYQAEKIFCDFLDTKIG